MLSRRSFLSTAAGVVVAGAGLTLARSASAIGATDVPLDPAVRASRIAWLNANTPVLRSIDIADDDFADLEPFAKAVGDARMVMLGEATHGDGTTFVGKSRLVRFLHERMGFDVLAFESGLYDMRKAWERMQSGENAHRAIRRGVFGIWTGSQEVQPLIDYVGHRARSSQPLELAGFDCQVSATASMEFLLKDLGAFLASHGVDAGSIAEWSRFRTVLSKVLNVFNLRQWRPSNDDLQLVLSTTAALRTRIAPLNGDEAAFWRQHLKNIEVYAELRSRWDPNELTVTLDDINLRDAAMADNLIWLARDVYPRRKIIVWAATFHNLRNPQLIESSTSEGSPADLTTMGHHVWQALGSSIFNVAFAAYEGEHGWAGEQPKALPPRAPGSLEDLWGATMQEYSFLDLRSPPAGGEWLQAPLVSCSLVDHDAFMIADWSKIVDAVVYTRTMRPATLVTTSNAPSGTAAYERHALTQGWLRR